MIPKSAPALAQNLTTVSASSIQDINGTKLAAGQLCFLGTDQQDNPISFQIGGGGQGLKRGYCSPVANGTVTSFTVPTPAATSPAGIYYRVTVKDSTTGQEVLRYTQVTFAGGTFNTFADANYTPLCVAYAPSNGSAIWVASGLYRVWSDDYPYFLGISQHVRWIQVHRDSRLMFEQTRPLQSAPVPANATKIFSFQCNNAFASTEYATGITIASNSREPADPVEGLRLVGQLGELTEWILPYLIRTTRSRPQTH